MSFRCFVWGGGGDGCERRQFFVTLNFGQQSEMPQQKSISGGNGPKNSQKWLSIFRNNITILLRLLSHSSGSWSGCFPNIFRWSIGQQFQECAAISSRNFINVMTLYGHESNQSFHSGVRWVSFLRENTVWPYPPEWKTVRPWKVAKTQWERLVFQPFPSISMRFS